MAKAAAKPKKSGRGRPFAVGDPRINRSGRPKLSPEQKAARIEAQAIIDAHTPNAAWRLVEWMNSKNFKASVPASTSLLDRGGVKGITRIELTGKDGAPIATENKVTHELPDPKAAARILTRLAAAGALPLGAEGVAAAGDAEDDEVHRPATDGAAGRVPRRKRS